MKRVFVDAFENSNVFQKENTKSWKFPCPESISQSSSIPLNSFNILSDSNIALDLLALENNSMYIEEGSYDFHPNPNSRTGYEFYNNCHIDDKSNEIIYNTVTPNPSHCDLPKRIDQYFKYLSSTKSQFLEGSSRNLISCTEESIMNLDHQYECHICETIKAIKEIHLQDISRKCTFCMKYFCKDSLCGGICNDCNQDFCKYCIVANFDRRYECHLCLDCNIN